MPTDASIALEGYVTSTVDGKTVILVVDPAICDKKIVRPNVN
jgi:hypothetical protein